MKRLLSSIVIAISVMGLISCEKKDDGKITAAKVDEAFQAAGYSVASANAYNSEIDDKNLEAIWQVSKKIEDDNVAAKIYVFSNTKALQTYWDAWSATYPNNSHELLSRSSQNALLTEIRVNGVMGTTQFGDGTPKSSDDLVKGLISVFTSIKY